MDQLPRLGKRELICLLLFTCNYVVSVWNCFLFLWVLGMGLGYNYNCIVKLKMKGVRVRGFARLSQPCHDFLTGMQACCDFHQ